MSGDEWVTPQLCFGGTRNGLVASEVLFTQSTRIPPLHDFFTKKKTDFCQRNNSEILNNNFVAQDSPFSKVNWLQIR